MRFIAGPTQLDYAPRACCVTNRDDGDFIDLQVVIDRPEPTRLYLKREVAEEAGQLCGMVPGAEVEQLRSDLTEMSRKLDETNDILNHQAELEELVGRGKEPVHA